MLNEARCSCGCRIFFQMPTVITTATGTIRDIPSILILGCVSCGMMYSVTTEAGRKTLSPCEPGTDMERSLFKAALHDWKNHDRPQDSDSFIVLEPADERDFDRLGVEKT